MAAHPSWAAMVTHPLWTAMAAHQLWIAMAAYPLWTATTAHPLWKRIWAASVQSWFTVLIFGCLGDFSRHQEHSNLPVQSTSFHHSVEQWITFVQLQWFGMASPTPTGLLHSKTEPRFSSIETNTSHPLHAYMKVLSGWSDSLTSSTQLTVVTRTHAAPSTVLHGSSGNCHRPPLMI